MAIFKRDILTELNMMGKVEAMFYRQTGIGSTNQQVPELQMTSWRRRWAERVPKTYAAQENPKVSP